jgi:SWI/SNF-related matrix-associated actin-dependent regulator of chromatin subfamily E protein 1
MTSSEEFQEELKKHCKKAVDDETFKKMVDKQYESARKELEERNKNQAANQSQTMMAPPPKDDAEGLG